MGHTLLFLKRIGFAYLLYFVLRLIFLLFNLGDYEDSSFMEIAHSFFVGLLFDSSAIVYTYSIFILLSLLPIDARNSRGYQKTVLFFYFLSSAIAIILSSIDFEFSKFTGKRSGVELFTVVGDDGNDVASYFIDFWYLGIIMLVLMYLIYKVYPRLKGKYNTSTLKEIVALILLAGFCLLGARGGTGLKPIKSFAAAGYVESGLVQLTINTPFNLISTIEGDALEKLDYLPLEEAARIVKPAKKYSGLGKDKPNVVILILESFGKEYVGHLGGEKPSTPFLDSLAKQMDCFSHPTFYSNGNVSMDAVPSILSGIPNWMDVSFSNSIYQTNRVENIGSALEEMGYNSRFYHGSNNGTMGFRNFLKMGGLNNYNGLDQYPTTKRDFDDHWGIYDGPYLQYIAQEMKEEKKPFFTTVFTLSSHHPYSIPANLKDSFKNYKDKISKSVAYTDYAVKHFFNSIKQEPWFSNTIFFITADHTSFSKNKYYNQPPGRYEVPLMIYSPQDSLTINSDNASHMDILPSVLQFVSYPDSFYSLGNSMFTLKGSRNTILFSNGLYWIKDGMNGWLTMKKDGEFNSFFFMEEGKTKKKYREFDSRAESLLNELRAYVETFTNNVIDNSMFTGH